jgi:bacteriorhodopsin
MGNRALDINGNPVRHMVNGPFSDRRLTDIGITVRGSNWYFAVCALMGVATLAFAAHSFKKPRPHRVFHYIIIAVTLVATISYFSLGSDLGQTGIPVQFRRRNPKVAGFVREIFWVRYIDWFITTPLLLLSLLLTAALPWPTILFTLLVNQVMIVCGLVGALTRTSFKWGYFAFGLACLFWIAYVILMSGRKHATALGPDVSKAYSTLGPYLIFLWFLYPVCWGLSEGGNVIAPNSEAIFYGILDIFSKFIYGALLLWLHRKIDPTRLGLRIRDYDDDPARHGNGYGTHYGDKTYNGHGAVTEPVATNTIHTHPQTTVV